MGKETPCGTCPKPLYLDPNNELAWDVFKMMSSQLRVAGLGTVLGVDLTVFPVVCDTLAIPHEDRKNLLDKILILNTIGVKYWTKESDTA